MIDIHCHILPGLDDGAFSPDESLLMAQFAAENGTTAIFCTPHSGPYPADRVTTAFALLKDALDERKIPLKLFLGQEIYLTQNYEQQIEDVQKGLQFTLNQTPYLLVEFHPLAPGRLLCDAVASLRAIGLKPIVAHPERYACVAEDFFLAHQLKDAGALLQLNKGSLRGAFGRDALQSASFLLEERMADFVASDAHSPYERTPKLRHAHAYISEQYSIDYADHLLLYNPARVASNKPIYSYNQ